MRQAIHRAAVSVAAAAFAFPGLVWADGYGCASCAGPPTPPPCAPACQSCQQPAVQHVHYHQKHGLFGHCHHAPMMMPMQPAVMQVPVAAPALVSAPVTQFVSAPVQQLVSAPVQQLVSAPVQQFVSAPVTQTLVSAPVQQFVSAPVAQTFVSAAVPQTFVAATVPQQQTQQPNNSGNSNTLVSGAVPNADLSGIQKQIDDLNTKVDSLDRRFEKLKSCIADCIEKNNQP